MRLAEGRVPGPMEASVEGLAHLAPIIRATHEHWDGTGYPDGLSGEEIPLASRIVHACDAWHAMISDRPYRQALSSEAAIEEIKKDAGKQVDRVLCRCLWST